MKRRKPLRAKRDHDLQLLWVQRSYPELEQWRLLAVEWLKGETRGLPRRLNALVCFLERYLIQQSLPIEPAAYLSRSAVVPDFYATACPQSTAGIKYSKAIYDFIEFVLLRHFSDADPHGRPVVKDEFHNPIPVMSASSLDHATETVYSPLPYGYIDELRKMLVQGPNFCDWAWAQNVLSGSFGGNVAADWFAVPRDLIDESDPDCVWRVRDRQERRPVLEMWCPARWVAMLIKLILPLRTAQVRLLDSGEADTWRYDNGTWTLNTHPLTKHLAQGTKKRPLEQGVLRRVVEVGDDAADVTLFINTNKTADIVRRDGGKGYVMPWLIDVPLHQNPFYWLEKLRNWQSKYNPLKRRTSWTELDGRHIKLKSKVQLAGYPDACFLFRTPEKGADQAHLPIANTVIARIWGHMLLELEQRLAARGETHANGDRIKLMPGDRGSDLLTTLFPLHGLRVSLITALALEGKVPFAILQKLAGHSRLLMTLYYTKPGMTHFRDALLDAHSRLEERKESTIQAFLLNTDHDRLVKEAISNSPSSLSVALPAHPGSRNPAGWMLMHHGVCLVGGNTSEIEDSKLVGGCYNGGPAIRPASSSSKATHVGVPGGSRNCVRCRWFVTEPSYLPSLAAHFNNIAYHFDEARDASMRLEKQLSEMKLAKAAVEADGKPFTEQTALRQQERVWEAEMKRFSDLAEDLVACWRLIERCEALLERPGSGMKLVPVGDATDVHIKFEEVGSELLQLAGVCEDAEVYPDLNPGKAVIRRSQLLDAALYKEGTRPVFLHLSERDQLRYGNAFLSRLAQVMDPTNPAVGLRKVVSLIDAGEQLRDYLGVQLEDYLPDTLTAPSSQIAIEAQA